MKKIALLLLVASHSALADWSRVGSDTSTTTYVDRGAREKGDGTIKMWSLVDHKDFQRMVEVGFYSQKFYVEYDCQGKRARGLAQSFHAERMGAGKTIYSDDTAQEWRSMPSEEDALLRAACE